MDTTGGDHMRWSRHICWILVPQQWHSVVTRWPRWEWLTRHSCTGRFCCRRWTIFHCYRLRHGQRKCFFFSQKYVTRHMPLFRSTFVCRKLNCLFNEEKYRFACMKITPFKFKFRSNIWMHYQTMEGLAVGSSVLVILASKATLNSRINRDFSSRKFNIHDHVAAVEIWSVIFRPFVVIHDWVSRVNVNPAIMEMDTIASKMMFRWEWLAVLLEESIKFN